MVRWRSRLVAVVALVAAATVGPVGGVAHAIDCTGDPPIIESPSSTTGAIFDEGPDSPRRGDPFADQPTTTIYEAYGYAGLRYDTYDLGCGSDFARSGDSIIGNNVANGFQWWSQVWVGISSALYQWAAEPGELFAPIDAQIEQVTDTFGGPALRWMAIALIALGVLILWRTKTLAYHEAAKHVGWAMLFVVTGLFLIGYPLKAAQMFDGAVATGVDWVRSELTAGNTAATRPADPGVGIAASKHNNVLYTTWVEGTFGNGQSTCADRFAPRIFDATARTVWEERRAEEDPDYAAELKAEKNAAYKATAAEVKEFSEDCYMNMIGQEPWVRIGAAAVGAFSATVVSLFDILAAAMIIAGYLAIRLLVMFSLALLVVAIVRRSVFIGAVTAVFGTVVNALFFGIAVGVFAVGQQVLLASSLPNWVAVFLIGLSAIMFWKATRGIRRVDPTGYGQQAVAKGRRWGRWAFDQAVAYGRTRLAVDHGMDDHEDDEPDDSDTSDDMSDEVTVEQEEVPASTVEVEQVRPAGELDAAPAVRVARPGTYIAGALPPGRPTSTTDAQEVGEEDDDVVEAEIVEDEEDTRSPVYIAEEDDQ